MARSGVTRAQENRAIRQEALREQLEGKGLMQQAIEIANKLEDLTITLEAVEVQRLKASADTKMKLVAKYMPDMKSVEHSGEINTNDPSEMSDSAIISRLAELESGRDASKGNTKAKDSQKVTH